MKGSRKSSQYARELESRKRMEKEIEKERKRIKQDAQALIKQAEEKCKRLRQELNLEPVSHSISSTPFQITITQSKMAIANLLNPEPTNPGP